MKSLVIIALMSSLALSNTITLKNSTVVVVRSSGQISSAQYKTGQEVILAVAQDVKVRSDGELVTVISAGSPVYATVQESKKGQMAGGAGSIIIGLNSTTAVDGSNIGLSGALSNSADSEVGATVAVGVILCPLFLLNKGDDGTIPVGAQLRAMTVGDYEIKVE